MPRVPSTLTYKAFRRESTVELLHGHSVPDPYRWLEHPDAQETKDFVQHQNSLFHEFTLQASWKSKFHSRLTQLYNYERLGCPMKRGSFYYFFYNPGLLPQSVLHRKSSWDSADSTVFFDVSAPFYCYDYKI